MSGKRIHLSVVHSTNSYTTELLSHNGISSWTVVSCDDQYAGKGQRGKRWEVIPRQNLTFSIAVEAMLPLEHQFSISACVVSAFINTLEAYAIKASFKWPNDILVDGNKIAGILIENQVADGQVKWSIIGIGLNVNQVDFPDYPWPATSMRKLRGDVDFDIEELLELLVKSIKQAWKEMSNLSADQRLNELNSKLYKIGESLRFESNDHLYSGRLLGIASDGGIRLYLPEGERVFYNGEIKLKRNDS